MHIVAVWNSSATGYGSRVKIYPTRKMAVRSEKGRDAGALEAGSLVFVQQTKNSVWLVNSVDFSGDEIGLLLGRHDSGISP